MRLPHICRAALRFQKPCFCQCLRRRNDAISRAIEIKHSVCVCVYACLYVCERRQGGKELIKANDDNGDDGDDCDVHADDESKKVASKSISRFHFQY